MDNTLSSKKEREDVSVFMVAYDHEKYISQAIEGVLKQKTEYSVKLIIGEDCSTDSTREIVTRYKEKYPERIELITSECNVGMMNNYTRTLNACNGRYVALCEGDDEWTDDRKLQKQIDFLESHPDYVMCTHAVRTIFVNVKEKDPFVKPMRTSTFDDTIIHGHFIPTLSVVFRRSALPVIPDWYKELLWGDVPLYLLVLHHGKNYYMDDVMGLKRKHPGGITQVASRNTKAFVKTNMEGNIYFYNCLNKHFNYEHKKVINPVIARFCIYIMIYDLKDHKYIESLQYLIRSISYSPSMVLRLSFNGIKRIFK